MPMPHRYKRKRFLLYALRCSVRRHASPLEAFTNSGSAPSDPGNYFEVQFTPAFATSINQAPARAYKNSDLH